MIRLRSQIAPNAGFDSFRDYQFKADERFDYTPADCHTFHEAIRHAVVPVYRQIQQQRRRHRGLNDCDPGISPWIPRAGHPCGRSMRVASCRPSVGRSSLRRSALKPIPRPEEALLYSAGRDADASARRQGCGTGGCDLRRAGGGDQRPSRPGVAAGRRGAPEGRAVPHRRQLGHID